jgi:hypothetical protein
MASVMHISVWSTVLCIFAPLPRKKYQAKVHGGKGMHVAWSLLAAKTLRY